MSWYIGKTMSWSVSGTVGFKNVATPVCFPLWRLRIKVSLAKGKSIYSYVGILYPALKISNPNFNLKLRWHKLFHRHLVISSFWGQLGYSLGLDISGDSYQGLLFFCPHWGLLYLSFLGKLHQSPKVQDFLHSFYPWSQFTRIPE